MELAHFTKWNARQERSLVLPDAFSNSARALLSGAKPGPAKLLSDDSLQVCAPALLEDHSRTAG
jgi:hypothetical protein